MIYKKVIEVSLALKREQLAELEQTKSSTPQNNRKYIELKAVIYELENCIDIAESILN